MKISSLLLILIVWLPLSAHAEFPVQGVHTSCSKNSFEVFAQNIMMDETPSTNLIEQEDGKEVYFGSKPRTVTCRVGTRIIKATVQTEEPREKGPCGGEPGSSISISIDGNDVMIGQLFNNHCYQSLDSVAFSQSEWVGFVAKVCGHTSGLYVEAEGCFEFKEGTILLLDLPLSPFPMEKFLNPKLSELAPNRGANEHKH
jgi:hypothetical protein